MTNVKSLKCLFVDLHLLFVSVTASFFGLIFTQMRRAGAHLVSGLFPGFHPACDEDGPVVTFFAIFCCLTDSGAVVGSGAVKDDFLILRQPGMFRFEPGQRDRSFQLHLPAGLFIAVGTDQESLPGCHVLMSLCGRYPRWFHGCGPLENAFPSFEM